jgi:penicillin-binding protein 1C
MPRLRLLRRLSLTAVLGVGLASGGFMLLDRAFPPDLSRLDRAGAEILDRNGRTLEMLPAAGGIWRLRTAADQVSPVFLDVLVRTEDRRFYDHGGVDPRAILRAVWQWARSGRVVSGGSTLTMQVARLLEPRPRTLRSKLVEAFRAVQLEERFSKRAILGIWLTLAPFGGNLEGVRAGSQAWFGKRPAALDRAEAALLVAIPRRPEGLRPDRHPDRALALRDRLLGDDAGAERDEALPTARLPFPRHAEPALRALVAASPQPDGMVTTFDLPLQVAAERLVADRLARLPPRVSIAVLVADARSRAVLAAVSGDGGPGRAGSLDLTMASRSPGSALKPLLYGIAFQDGLVTPATPVSDLPRHFGGYAPENFDRSFAGTVTAAEALRRSLNLPAVALLDRIGPTRFAARLNAAGARLHLPPGAAPSLPLALGGAGIRLRDLLRLYAALASDGASLPLRLQPGAPPGPALPLLQRSAARLVADVITRDFPDGGPPGVAWKTGTSWGGRDAWAMGFDARSVAGVWLGRPDGTALPGFTGAATALPVIADVFGLLPPAPRAIGTDDTAEAGTTTEAEAGVHLLFPPPGATLSADGPVPLRAMGGRRPLAFAVDGSALPSVPASRSTLWTPGSPGFYTITVQDADGAMARAQVRVR